MNKSEGEQRVDQACNLHAVWDSGLIRYLNEDESALSKRLLSKPSPTESLK